MKTASKNLIQRIEPPFWFSDMHNPELQILFYGKNISQCQITIENSSAITNVKRTDNPNFIFVTINTRIIQNKIFEFIFKLKNKNYWSWFRQQYRLKFFFWVEEPPSLLVTRYLLMDYWVTIILNIKVLTAVVDLL